MNRRAFLRNMLGTGVAAGAYTLGGPFGFSLAQATHTVGNPVLVVVFQRGGCDGLNTVVPYGESAYYALRSTNSIAPPNASDPLSAIPINDGARGFTNFFGLNPHMSGMWSLYNNNDMAIVPAVQYPNSSHSHFDGQDFMEGGVPNTNTDGWLYRHIASKGVLNGLEAISLGQGVANALRGPKAIQSLSFLEDVFFPPSAGDVLTRLRNYALPLYEEVPAKKTFNRLLTSATGKLTFQNYDALAALDPKNYNPSNGASYPVVPGTSTLSNYGKRMRDAAQLIKANIGVEVITVNIGGFDTHANQGGAEPTGRHSERIREFSEGITALYTDLGSEMNRVVILTMTEFGRTMQVNGSNGTDHGDAGAWFLIGKNIQSGIHGTWPGLAQEQLADGRYLQFTVDYRDVMGDVLVNHLGHTLGEMPGLIPSHAYRPVGLFG